MFGSVRSGRVKPDSQPPSLPCHVTWPPPKNVPPPPPPSPPPPPPPPPPPSPSPPPPPPRPPPPPPPHRHRRPPPSLPADRRARWAPGRARWTGRASYRRPGGCCRSSRAPACPPPRDTSGRAGA